MTNADNFFGGGPQLSWAITKPDGSWERDQAMLNVIRGGVIVKEPEVRQATKMGSGEPLYWDEAKLQPKMQMVIVLRCDGSGQADLPNGRAVQARDERNNPTDNGDRQLYVNGKDLRDAIASAFRAAGAEGLRVGSTLLVAWTGTRPAKIKGGYPASTFAALYVPGQVAIPDRQNPTGQNPFQGAAPAEVPSQAAGQVPASVAPPPAQPPADNPFGGPSQVPAAAAAMQGGNPFA